MSTELPRQSSGVSSGPTWWRYEAEQGPGLYVVATRTDSGIALEVGYEGFAEEPGYEITLPVAAARSFRRFVTETALPETVMP